MQKWFEQKVGTVDESKMKPRLVLGEHGKVLVVDSNGKVGVGGVG